VKEGEVHINTLRTRLKKHRPRIGLWSLRQVERYPEGLEYHLVRVDALRRILGAPVLRAHSLSEVETFMNAQGIT
jgi:hypothetical protein